MAEYFGEKEGMIDLPEFSIEQILKKNIIFCSALFRKADWEKAGGYNINLVYGLEDWDFWLSILELGLKPYRIPKTLFYYRIKKVSMLKTISDENQFFMIKNVIFNHRQLFKDCAEIYIVPRVSQVFVDTGAGFNPNQVVSVVIFGSENKIEFDISGIRHIKQIRFDPINDLCAIRISRICLACKDGTLFQVDEYTSNALYHKNDTLFFSTDDPQLEFKVPEKEIQIIRVELEFIAIGKKAYLHILKELMESCRNHEKEKYQNADEIFRLTEELQKSERRYIDIVESTAWKLTRPIRWVFGLAGKTSGAILRNQKSSLFHEIMFIYYCYFKKNKIPPPRFNFVGGIEFSEIGKSYFGNIVKFCEVNPKDNILDIGCGIGRVAGYFTGYINPYGNYSGFDIVKKGIKWCSQKISKDHPNFVFRHADIFNKEYNPKGTILAEEFDFPYKDEEFDVVFATSVFTHMLPDGVIHYLKEIHRVLKKKGKVLISAFILDSESKQKMGRSPFPFKIMNDHYAVMLENNPEAAIAYEENYLRKIIKEADLNILDPIHFGTWSTRNGEIHGQDIIVAQKNNPGRY
jgi:SAM-dependent methyltransferase